MKFNKRQLEKISEQFRLLAWAQGAILYNTLHLFTKQVTISTIIFFWIGFQILALILDKGEKNG